MRTAIAILTFNRANVLQHLLKGIVKQYPTTTVPVAIFDDCSYQGDTTMMLKTHSRFLRKRPDLVAEEYVSIHQHEYHIFLGTRNLGVARNSNRALKWFMDDTTCDHLLLMNDDLEVLGDVASFYATAHEKLNIGLFCLADFTDEPHRWAEIKEGGYTIKILNQLNGHMMSMTRKLITDIGYFDTEFGSYGEEHSEFTYRAQTAGHSKVMGTDMKGVDVVMDPVLVRHTDDPSSISDYDKFQANAEAAVTIQRLVSQYPFRNPYRPFGLTPPKHFGAYNRCGVPIKAITDPVIISSLPQTALG